MRYVRRSMSGIGSVPDRQDSPGGYGQVYYLFLLPGNMPGKSHHPEIRSGNFLQKTFPGCSANHLKNIRKSQHIHFQTHGPWIRCLAWPSRAIRGVISGATHPGRMESNLKAVNIRLPILNHHAKRSHYEIPFLREKRDQSK